MFKVMLMTYRINSRLGKCIHTHTHTHKVDLNTVDKYKYKEKNEKK